MWSHRESWRPGKYNSSQTLCCVSYLSEEMGSVMSPGKKSCGQLHGELTDLVASSISYDQLSNYYHLISAIRPRGSDAMMRVAGYILYQK